MENFVWRLPVNCYKAQFHSNNPIKQHTVLTKMEFMENIVFVTMQNSNLGIEYELFFRKDEATIKDNTATAELHCRSITFLTRHSVMEDVKRRAAQTDHPVEKITLTCLLSPDDIFTTILEEIREIKNLLNPKIVKRSNHER